MSILLLAECWPYRNSTGCHDNSQSRLLAQACGITFLKLEQLCTCAYVLNKFVPSCKRDHRYRGLLRMKLESRPMLDEFLEYDLIITIGKRLMGLMVSKRVIFFQEYYTSEDVIVVCIPNPLAEMWWKEDTNIVKVKKYMQRAFEIYGH